MLVPRACRRHPIGRVESLRLCRRDTNPANSAEQGRDESRRFPERETSPRTRACRPRMSRSEFHPSQIKFREGQSGVISEARFRIAVFSRGLLVRTETLGHGVVALKIDIVKRSGVGIPPGNFAILRADDVGRCLQLDASATERPLNQRHLKFDRGSRIDHPRREKINSSGADIFRHQGDGDGFDEVADSGESHGQAQAGSWSPAALLRDANRMRWYADEPARLQRFKIVVVWRARRQGLVCRQHYRQLPNRPHLYDPLETPAAPRRQVLAICSRRLQASMMSSKIVTFP